MNTLNVYPLLSGKKSMADEASGTVSLEQEELRAVSRTVAEIEWLLLVLVLLYQVFSKTSGETQIAIAMALFLYAAFIMSFHYANFYPRISRWKIAIETWGMIRSEEHTYELQSLMRISYAVFCLK